MTPATDNDAGQAPLDAATTPAPALNAGRKDDAGKARWDLVPWDVMASVVRVLTFGARRYGDDNWRRVPGVRRRYFAAAMRHVMAWERGEVADPDTGESHLAHAICCLLFLAGHPESAVPPVAVQPQPAQPTPAT